MIHRVWSEKPGQLCALMGGDGPLVRLSSMDEERRGEARRGGQVAHRESCVVVTLPGVGARKEEEEEEEKGRWNEVTLSPPHNPTYPPSS